ncbi:hypothetical protein RJ640_014600, partial [Escallonia rubra]
MNYEQRLLAAAKHVYTADSTTSAVPVNCADYGVTAALKPHQVEGVSWLIRRYLLGVNSILGDEMGLGKTLQAIALLSYLKVCQKLPGPFLVLCPLSVTHGWVSEIANFAPKLRVLCYIGDKEQRRNLRRSMYKHVKEQFLSPDVPRLPFDLLLTTYDIALVDQDFLSQMPWHYAVIDEAQRLKNPSSSDSWCTLNGPTMGHPHMTGLVQVKSTIFILLQVEQFEKVVLYNVLRERFVMPRRLLMTGTPIQNNLSELWALMHFIMPSIFGTLDQFLSAFKEAGDPLSGQDAAKVKEQFRILKYLLGAFMLRRTKSKLIESGTLVLPPLTEITVMAPLVPLQQKMYVSILRKELPRLLSLSSGGSSHPSLQNIVMQLRKACSHPYLFPGIEPEPYEEGEHLVQASGKLIILDLLLQKLRDSGHRVLLFAQMTHTLDILQRLDGSIRAEERFAAIRSFSRQQRQGSLNNEADQSSAFVFLISTRAGGVGLNLVAADT